MYRGKRPVPGGTLFFTQLYHDILNQLIARLSRLEQIVRIGEGKDGIRERLFGERLGVTAEFLCDKRVHPHDLAEAFGRGLVPRLRRSGV